MNEFTNNMDMLFEGFLKEDKKQIIYKVLNDYNKILFDALQKCMKEFNKGLSSFRNKLSVSISSLTNSVNKGYRYAKKFILKSNDKNIQESKDVDVYIKRNGQLFEANILEEKSVYLNNIDDPSKIIMGKPFNSNISMDILLKGSNSDMDKVNDQFNKIEHEIINEHVNKFIIDEENNQILTESFAVVGAVLGGITNGVFMLGNGILSFATLIPFLIKSLKLLLIVSVIFFIISVLALLGSAVASILIGSAEIIAIPFQNILPWLILIPTSLLIPTIIYKLIKLKNDKLEKWVDNIKYIENNDKDVLNKNEEEDEDIELNMNNSHSINNGLKIVDSQLKNDIENDPQVKDLKNDIDKYKNQVKLNKDIDNKIKSLF
jgi:hypothetical protein